MKKDLETKTDATQFVNEIVNDAKTDNIKPINKVNFRDEWISIQKFADIMNETENHEKLSGSIVNWGDTAFEFKLYDRKWLIAFAGRPIAMNVESLERAITMVANQEWDIVRCVAAIMSEYMFNEIKEREVTNG